VPLFEVTLPLERVDGARRPGEAVCERRVELGAIGEDHRRSDFRDELRAQRLLLALDGGLQLLEAALAERVIRRPVGLVERAASRGDGAPHVVNRRVGHLAEDLLGGGVDVVEAPTGRGFHQLAVDQHAHFAVDGAGAVGFDRGHGGAPFVVRGRLVRELGVVES
jgi:hypothetical protein